jgi:hypothetical protein
MSWDYGNRTESDVDFELTFCDLYARQARHESTTPRFAVI